MGDPFGLLPPDFSGTAALFLIAVSFFASALTALLGLGGGIAMLAAMSLVVPVFALIPVHGVVQLGSNVGRAIVLRRRIDRGILAVFVAGSVVGAAIGSQILVTLPGALHLAGLGAFVLAMTWLPLPGLDRLGPLALALVGAASTFVSLFVGASGPIVAAALSGALADRRVLIGTHAACLVIQNVLKLAVFALAGFAFVAWLPLLAGMIFTGFLGTLVGTRLLERTPEARFRLVFKIVITLLGLDMVRRGVLSAM